MQTILLVDDEPKIVTIAEDYLRQAGFDVLVARDGVAAIATARARQPDLVVLDLGLPRIDGLEVARTLRAERDVPIVMLTARDDELDRILGLELGADDYITKPFSPRELVARVRAVLRRTERRGEHHDALHADRIVAGDIALDVPRMRVSVAGRTVEVTPAEFQLLATLARRPGRIFTRAQLLDAVHGDALESYERAIDTHVKNLRRKIEAEPHRPAHILTVHGVGYRLADDD
ncbi:MAG: response regulator transcription factor [Dehalococcoidia bacterium]|nr:response regulator transcription factor [Dehalococcoidia bacterium]